MAVLLDNISTAGYKSILWDGRADKGEAVASGMYIYRLEAKALNSDEKFASIKKMVLLK